MLNSFIETTTTPPPLFPKKTKQKELLLEALSAEQQHICHGKKINSRLPFYPI